MKTSTRDSYSLRGMVATCVIENLRPSRRRESVYGPAHEHGEDQQREHGLHHHQNLRPLTQEGGVRGAEGGARVEGEEEVVQKARGPGAGGLAVEVHLGEQEVIADVPFPVPLRRLASVYLPVPDGDRDHV